VRGMCRYTLGCLLALALLIFNPVDAAPKKELWERWTAHNSQSRAPIDHRLWDSFLRRNVRVGRAGINRIDYANVPRPERLGLNFYIEFMGAVAIGSHNRLEQLAYWINLYNALTVQVVMQNFPVKSIRDINISPGLFSSGPWDKKLISVEGVPVSLNDIEHRILRPIWNDARIHYALNCASIGCPNLQLQAFKGSTVNALLESAGREFVNHSRAVSVHEGDLIVSRIYDWFRTDFGENDEKVIAHLLRFANDKLKELLQQHRAISDYQYDWSLNFGNL